MKRNINRDEVFVNTEMQSLWTLKVIVKRLGSSDKEITEIKNK